MWQCSNKVKLTKVDSRPLGCCWPTPGVVEREWSLGVGVRFQTQLCHVRAVWPWAHATLTSPSPSVLICKWGQRWALSHRFVVRIKWSQCLVNVLLHVSSPAWGWRTQEASWYLFQTLWQKGDVCCPNCFLNGLQTTLRCAPSSGKEHSVPSPPGVP